MVSKFKYKGEPINKQKVTDITFTNVFYSKITLQKTVTVFEFLIPPPPPQKKFPIAEIFAKNEIQNKIGSREWHLACQNSAERSA